MPLQSWSHVGVCCSDLERSTRFYCEVLGFRQLFTVELGPEVAATMELEGRFLSRMLARDELRLELLQWIEPKAVSGGTRQPMTRPGLTHLAFRVDTVDELWEAAARAGGAAHPETLSRLPGVGDDSRDAELVYLTDPDGTRIELMAGVPDLSAL
ncbi:MAG: VOC family protein [Actinomycetota bacterium]|nr:VOC family protein [Actinomycetota bacterium]